MTEHERPRDEVNKIENGSFTGKKKVSEKQKIKAIIKLEDASFSMDSQSIKKIGKIKKSEK